MKEDPKGMDPNSTTGTRDKVDPETGAIGTAGTPVTTGYGESASTIGTGTSSGEREHKAGDFDNATPETEGYTHGVSGDIDAHEDE